MEPYLGLALFEPAVLQIVCLPMNPPCLQQVLPHLSVAVIAGSRVAGYLVGPVMTPPWLPCAHCPPVEKYEYFNFV